jgi:tetratricopeptide (TPR) repeat protein
MTIPIASEPDSRFDGLSPSAKRRLLAATQALNMGQLQDAESRLRGLLAVHPDHPEVLRMFAGLHTLRGDPHSAIEIMKQAIAKRPDDAAYLSSLGSALIDAVRYDEAIAALRRACELDPTYTTAWYNLGLALAQCMRTGEAIEAIQQAVSRAPTLEVNARVILGDMYRAEQRVDEAVSEYRAIIGTQKHAGKAWWGLAEIKTRHFADEDFELLREAMLHPAASQSDLIAMGFALAKALDDRGRYAESLTALDQAHARVLANRHWNATAYTAHVEATLSLFPSPLAGADASLGGEVIFIASMPRSGSTLTEQILASHSQIDGGGELMDLPSVLSEESQRVGVPFPQFVQALTPKDWERMGKRYLERTARWRNKRPRFTDKMPGNWVYIGAIRAMLPAARIIVVRRDPLETCFACYRQLLPAYEYTNSFVDLAAAWHDFDRSVKHWLRIHPQHVYESSYEALVSDPTPKIRELLDFCGLPFEQACLDFHKTERKVHTPSATQVREPLRRDTARADRYGALLDPLRIALGMPPYSSAV